MDGLEHDYLPPQLREIAELIGLAAATELVSAYGGTRLYIPSQPGPDHVFVRTFGAAAADRLARARGGTYIDVPRCVASVRAARDRAIVHDGMAGATQRELARRYGMTERNVRLIWRAAGLDPDDRQGELF